jgi:hypothetical protein
MLHRVLLVSIEVIQRQLSLSIVSPMESKTQILTIQMVFAVDLSFTKSQLRKEKKEMMSLV